MDHDPTILTCDIGADLLDQLARRILDGTLVPGPPGAAAFPLFQWQIFLPTRRAVRRLQSLLRQNSRARGVALPTIKPIGDLDEDVLALQDPVAGIPKAISAHGLLCEVMALLHDWAIANPHIAIAQDIAGSMTRVQHLAESLIDLMQQAETEERDLTDIASVYGLDLAGHRAAILDVLRILTTELPVKLQNESLVTPAARRNLLIRLQANAIRRRKSKAPLVIAGTTGTNPATRDLVAAIAFDSAGCVILPGLDKHMADADWLSLSPSHPQFNLKKLLNHLALDRTGVVEFVPSAPDRSWLASETMRPSTSSGQWHKNLGTLKSRCDTALTGVSLLHAPTRHLEARAIALALRHAVHDGMQSVALVTPDRDLASRVATELRRWAIIANDTRGETLLNRGAGHLLRLLCDCAQAGCSAQTVVAVLHDPYADFGMDETHFRRAVQLYEIHVLRQQGTGTGLHGLDNALQRAELARQHERVRNSQTRVGDDDWRLVWQLARAVTVAMAPLLDMEKRPLGEHVAVLMRTLGLVSPQKMLVAKDALELTLTLQAIVAEQHRLPALTFAESVPLILTMLQTVTVRPVEQGEAKVGIYGLLEARLMHFDLAVLGGLNEGIWPSSPDSGPWLNRPMRDKFGLQQPERDIGLTAHDFVAGLGHSKVMLSWSQRIGTQPVLASRWILRLRTVMEASGFPRASHLDQTYIQLAMAMDKPTAFTPVKRPWPRPPVAARARSFSVTDIERWIRDPYALYARKTLRLRPLDPLAMEPDARLRGSLFHEALKMWNQASQSPSEAASLEHLIAAGRDVFAPLAGDADVTTFWWPRFLRMAQWIHQTEQGFRPDLAALHAETRGRLLLTIAHEEFELIAIADRIDVLRQGTARVIDYKSGDPPTASQVQSGFSPQLTLESAMLAHGAFDAAGVRRVEQALYIKISGGRPPGKITDVGDGDRALPDLVAEHWQGLQRKLATLLEPATAFPPRFRMLKAEDPADYDHLSRHLEWRLA